MTDATRIQASLNAAFAAAVSLAGLVVGCGGTPAVEVSDTGASGVEAQTTKSRAGRGFIAVEETAEDPGYCGYFDLGTDEEGREQAQEERYYYPRINALLAANGDLKAAVGKSEISTCADARSFMRIYRNFHSPTAMQSIEKSAAYADFPRLPPESNLKSTISSDGEVPKMYKGAPSDQKEIVKWMWLPEGRNTRWQTCTAIRLSGTTFLTAAHCLSTNYKTGASQTLLTFSRAVIFHALPPASGTRQAGVAYHTCSGTLANCANLHLDGLIHPNYLGSGDANNDIAIIHVRWDSQASIRSSSLNPYALNEFNGQYVAYLSPKTPIVGLPETIYAWGPNEGRQRSETYVGFYQEVTTSPVPIFMKGDDPWIVGNGFWIGSDFSIESGSTNNFLCFGDSGAAAYTNSTSFNLVNGVLSNAEDINALTSCAMPDSLVHFTRIDWSLDFIRWAMSRLQTGESYPTCECAFVPATGDTTGDNWEANGAYIRCNVGCEDPLPPL